MQTRCGEGGGEDIDEDGDGDDGDASPVTAAAHDGERRARSETTDGWVPMPGVPVYGQFDGAPGIARLVGHDPVLRLYRVELPVDRGGSPAETASLAWEGDDRWRSVPLPECLICMDSVARALPRCGCPSPRVCAACCEALLYGPDSSAAPVCPACRGSPPSPVGTFELAALPAVAYPVFVRDLDGRLRPLGVSGDWTVAQLAFRLFLEIGVPPWQQRLIFSGTQMEHDCKLEHYGLDRDRTLYLCLRLRGD